jgi:hypothetical protein
VVFALPPLAASSAAAATRCVAISHAGCVPEASAAAAFANAAAGDRIELGAVTATTALADGGKKLDVVGSGEGATALTGGLTLSAAGSQITGVRLGALDLSGSAVRVRVDGTARLRGNAALIASVVAGSGGVDAVAGAPRLESVALELAGGPGLRVRCAATLRARHVTLAGTPSAAVTAACPPPDSRAVVSDSILWVPGSAVFTQPSGVSTSYSDYPVVAGHRDGAGDRHDDPLLAPGLRLAGGSPLLDAGTPEPLAADEWPEERDGLPRAADGNGDGIARRDPGAFELPPPAVPAPAGNLVRDAGAEDGGAWALAGGFTAERYGNFPFPSAATAAALGAGGAFFAGGSRPSATASQTVDITRLAPEIDLGTANAALSGLLGGYRADADAASLEATFRDPAGAALGTVALAAPNAAERANATTLLARRRSDAVPPLTRSIDVTLRATRATGGYDDAYFDGIGLTVTAPGAPPARRAPARRPFAGLRVLTGVASLDKRGRIAVRLACVDATVGRCAGVVTLTAVFHKRARAERVARASVSLGPGATRRVHMQLTKPARRMVRGRHKVHMTLFAAARDGQGVTRASTVPVTVKSPRRKR